MEDGPMTPLAGGGSLIDAMRIGIRRARVLLDIISMICAAERCSIIRHSSEDYSVTTSKPHDDRTREVDLDEVTALIDNLERDLQKIQGDSRDVQHLKDEVETLRNLLRSPVRRHHWVRDALHGIRERFDDALDAAVAGGVEASRYIAEIGRILGM